MKTYQPQILDLWKKTGRTIIMNMEGTSMLPLIRAKDTVSVKLIPSAHLKTGDIAAFLQNKKIVVHRIIKKKIIKGKLWLCQKGDNLNGWSWIAGKDMLGRVEAIGRSGQKILMSRKNMILLNRVAGAFGWCLVTFYDMVRPNFDEKVPSIPANIYRIFTRMITLIVQRMVHRQDR